VALLCELAQIEQSLTYIPNTPIESPSIFNPSAVVLKVFNCNGQEVLVSSLLAKGG